MIPPEQHASAPVQGERSTAVVDGARSVQSRVSSALAAGVMIALGAAALAWYYAHVMSSRTGARSAAASAGKARVQAEMSLPALGPVTPPHPVTANAESPGSAPPTSTVAPELEAPAALTALPLQPSTAAVAASVGATPTVKSPRELARERRLSGEVFARHSGQPPASAMETASEALVAGNAPGGRAVASGTGTVAPSGHSELGGLLQATATPAAEAHMLPNGHFLLPKGAFIDCTLETAIDSSLPGMTTCITAADTFGADGKVVLLERGSKLVGETRGQVQQGQARVFVVWTSARTPSGVTVPLDSPGTDALGRSGLPGEVERHFWERFGAAMLVSVVEGAVQAGVQAANHSGGSVIYAPSTSQDVMTEVLKSTVNIPPTVVKPNGDRIEILVARDIDFRSVYELRTTGAER